MIRNYIKIAWRSLTKQKLFSIINIFGLAVGLAVCIMILLYVAHETSYDRFHKNADRIFHPSPQIKTGGNIMNVEYMSYATGPLIKQSQPTVESYVRMLAYFKPVIAYNPGAPQQRFAEKKLLFADPGFFNFFSFKLISGSPADVLNKPFSVVISQDMAKKYFGTQNPVGKTITLRTDSAYNYQVTGVAENNPSNSSIEFNFVASNSSLQTMKEASLYSGPKQISFGAYSVYLLLKHATDTASLRRSLDATAKRDKLSDETHFYLESLTDTHLKGNFGDLSNLKYLKIFPLVAGLILLLALANYMSLSTARATIRAKEVGVRKVSGASRKTIAMQFYVESAVFTCLSFVLGYLLCYAFKPWFLSVLQLKIDNSFLYSPQVLTMLFALLLITVLIAGSYPSLILSAFKPVVTLKGKMGKQAGGVTVRRIFTTLQFAISVGLIICGIIIDRQLYYFRHVDTGLSRANVITVPIGNGVGKNYPAFKRDVQMLAGVNNAATSQHALFTGYDMFYVDGKTKGESTAVVSFIADKSFIGTIGLQWKYPPAPNTEMVSHNKTIINEAAISELHLPVNPIGSYLKSSADKFEIVGVIKNFNFTSLEYAVRPSALIIVKDDDPIFSIRGCTLFVKIKPHTNLPTLLGAMQNLYKKYDTETPFNYTFMDDAFNEQYKAEDRLASIFSVFTYITVLLATLGLFGLAAFTIQNRTKEIGIRKVLGASVASINSLLSRDFIKLVLLSIIIASPIAWWAMHKWLQGFAYRIAISWWIFAAAGLVAILTAIVTVSYHGVRAAVANPVNSLRSE